MQVVTPYVPGMTTRHGRVLVLYTCLGECFASSNTILVSDVFFTTHIELVNLVKKKEISMDIIVLNVNLDICLDQAIILKTIV